MSAATNALLPDDATGMVGWSTGSGRRALLIGLAGYENPAAPAALRFELAGGAVVSSNRAS